MMDLWPTFVDLRKQGNCSEQQPEQQPEQQSKNIIVTDSINKQGREEREMMEILNIINDRVDQLFNKQVINMIEDEVQKRLQIRLKRFKQLLDKDN